MTPDVVIASLGLGNARSVRNMLLRMGITARVATDPREAQTGAVVILPGVGSFDAGAARLSSTGWGARIRTLAEDPSTTILGICLGMQLLTEGSDEGVRQGLGLIPGRFSSFKALISDRSLPIPHMGWTRVTFRPDLIAIDPKVDWRFYFVHSYCYPDIEAPYSAGVSTYGVPFTSVLRRGNVIGMQFHPEKSHRFGMRLLTGVLESAR